MFNYRKYSDDRSSTSTSSSWEEEEVDDKCCCGLVEIFDCLPIIAGFALTVDVALACLSLKSPVFYAFFPLILAAVLSVCLTVRGVKKEKRALVKVAAFITLAKSIAVTLMLVAVVVIFFNYEDFRRLTNSSAESSLFFQLLCGLPLSLLTLALQAYCSLRAMEIIERRDEIYVIPPAKQPAKLRPSIKVILEKYKLQKHQLGVEVFAYPA
ncbi:hypothetical protein M3Y99_01949100 [Aphelenchoides fujianensis]|nr:hypothetical protein M3Y99_01949100 [Aphelenchoides fujianensis]